MILENETSLQRWLSNQLKPISDADPLALAMYVIALLKHHDKKGEVLKNHCYDQLLDFLKEHTRGFLESLFNVIKDGSYVTEITSEDEEEEQATRVRADDDFDDDDDSSRRRDRRRGSDSIDGDDYSSRRKRPKHDPESPTNLSAIIESPPVMVPAAMNVVNNKHQNESAERPNYQKNRLEQPVKSPDVQAWQVQQNKQKTYAQSQQLQQQYQQQAQPRQQQQKQPMQKPYSSVPISVARAANDKMLMGGFDRMGPETQRAIFGTMGSSMPNLMSPVPLPQQQQQQQQQQHPSSLGGMRIMDQMTASDYSRAVNNQVQGLGPGPGAEETFGAGMGFLPNYRVMGLAPSISSGFAPPLQRIAPVGMPEPDSNFVYPAPRPLPPPTDFPGVSKKPAPPNVPPPLIHIPLQLVQLPHQSQMQPHRSGNYDQMVQSNRRQEGDFNYGGAQSRRIGQGQSQGQSQGQGNGQQQVSTLLEHERCTLKCTGLPQHVKEGDLRKHFMAFGRVVELQLIENEGDKKGYNECLVQMGSAFEAKKCLNSPSAVLNNRFVRLMHSVFNIVPFADVQPLIEQDTAAAATATAEITSTTAQANRSTKRWVNEGSAVPPVHRHDDEKNADPIQQSSEKKAKGVGLQGRGFGVSNKFVAAHNVKGNRESISAASSSSSASATAATNDGDHFEDNSLYSGIENNEIETSDASEHVVAPVIVSVPLTKEDIAVQQQYEGLRALRQQADTICRQKESLLQGQIDQYRTMLEKLESSPDNVTKTNLLESIEGKIVDLQSQLRLVKDQRETGVVPQQMMPPAYGGRGGRGYSSGRGRGGSYPPQYTGRGRGFTEDSWGAGRGRGRFGGRGGRHPGYVAIDLRTRSINVFQPPEGFDASAKEHFGRFGELESIVATPDGSLTVQFKERRDAEAAKTKGAFYNSGVLLLDWHEGDTASDL